MNYVKKTMHVRKSKLAPRSQSREMTTQTIETILKASLLGGFFASALVIPNSPIAFKKPLEFLLDRLDRLQKEREVRRVIIGMKRQKLVTGSYEHGLVITTKGKERLAKLEYNSLSIKAPKQWDKKWRIVIFDIPQSKDQARRDFSEKIKSLGFQLLQLSVWIHPYPCRDELSKITETLGVTSHVTIIETAHIDHEEILKKRFIKLFQTL